MTKYKIETIENNFLESIKFLIIERNEIDGKMYSDILYEFDDINRANSKLNFLKALENL